MEKEFVIATNCFIPAEGGVWLGMKKRGFGVMRWNGFGGKQKEGETLEETAIREVWEETGGKEGKDGIKVKKLEKQGIIEFDFMEEPLIVEMHAYLALGWEGKAVETGEMRPQLFNLSAIPYRQMWAVDSYWLPLLLKRRKFIGNAVFGSAKKNNVLYWHLREVKKIS